MTFARTAASFRNPDFVDVVVHSYRHRFGFAAGDPAAADWQARLAAMPPIAVPAVVLHGGSDGVSAPDGAERQRDRFTGTYVRRVLPGIGHNIPQEAPSEFAKAVLDVARG